MAVHLLEVAAPTLNMPRAHPCAARDDHAARICGATPAWLYRRVCIHGHRRDVWLCRTHEVMVRRARAAACQDCADRRDRPHRCPVALVTDPAALDLIRAGL